MSAVGDWVQDFSELLLRYLMPVESSQREIRHDIKAAITVKSGAFTIDCMTINMSTSGILVDRALESSKPGMRVEVTAGGGVSGISGRVIRIGANSTAIRIDGNRGSSFMGVLRGHAIPQTRTLGRAPARPVLKPSSNGPTALLPYTKGH